MTEREKQAYEAIRQRSGQAAAEAYLAEARKSDFDGGCLLWCAAFLVMAFLLTRYALWPMFLALVVLVLALVVVGVQRLTPYWLSRGFGHPRKH